MIEDVAGFIDSGSTALTAGTNLFMNFLPDTPNTAVAVYETGGAPPEFVFGSTTPAWRNPRVQVVSRSTSSQTARTRIETVYRRLAGVSNTTLQGASGPNYLSITPVQDPFLLGRDEQARVTFACNFAVSRPST